MGGSRTGPGSLAPEPVLSTSSLGEALPDSSLDAPTSHPLALLVPTGPGSLSASQ